MLPQGGEIRVLLIEVAANSVALGQGTSNWKGDGSSLLQFCGAYLQAADSGSIASGAAIHATSALASLLVSRILTSCSGR